MNAMGTFRCLLDVYPPAHHRAASRVGSAISTPYFLFYCLFAEPRHGPGN